MYEGNDEHELDVGERDARLLTAVVVGQHRLHTVKRTWWRRGQRRIAIRVY